MNALNPAFYKEKIFSAAWFRTYGLLVIGSFVLAMGYTFFMTPYKIVPGGIYGIATIFHYKLGFPIGMAALCFNLPLSLWGVKVLGKQFGLKTFICFILVAVFADGVPFLLERCGHPHPYDPFQLQDEVLLASIFGGVIIGIGVGLILKTRSSSGGTDVFTSILSKLTHKPIGMLQMIVDSSIVLCGLLVFQDWKIPFYSWLTIFLMGKVIDIVMQGYSSDKTFFIVTDKIEEIRQYILVELHRGGSIMPVKGMFNRTEKEMIMTVVSRREMVTLQRAIYKIDPQAFTTILNAQEILGLGFKRIEE
ncbi:YitT family protein [uncultured Odoribacter sp.]|uniref:YitT family protein n=1 Tax=uncultured Odoribacter sp. TaxID=876416 RepID=UPI00260C1074|nr:YitT family protein [uncultured Odoribacter sp.]